MSTITAKINLTKLDRVALTKGKDGQDLLVIDIAASHLYKSDKDNVFLDLFLFENNDKKYSEFSIKQSVPKDVREYEKSNNIQRSFLGNADYFTPGGEQAPETKQAEDIADDLPF
jgi:hypothetical protein